MRIDEYLVKTGMFSSRNKAQESIKRGEISVCGKIILKPSFNFEGDESAITINRVASDFVSIGGFKLEKALNDFALNVKDLIVADIGASTGGFTDCVLQRGAKKVYAIDLNDDLLHERLKKDDRVNLIVKNAKGLVKSDFCEELDLIVADLSFISARSVMSVFSDILEKGKSLILLIKPQFEVGEKVHFKNGIVNDEKLRRKICEEVVTSALENGFCPLKITTAPLNKDKNVEYLLLAEKGENTQFKMDNFII